jgi:hypothetical protein
VDAILTALVDQLKTVTELSNRVYSTFDYAISSYPTVLIQFLRDRLSRRNNVVFHNLFFNVALFCRKGESESSEDFHASLLGSIGLLSDEIEGFDDPIAVWESIAVESIESGVPAQGESFIFVRTDFIVRITKRW